MARAQCVGGEEGAVAYVDGDLKAVISSPLENVSGMVRHALRGGVGIVVGDDCCKVVCVGAMEVRCLGVVSNKEVEEARGDDLVGRQHRQIGNLT